MTQEQSGDRQAVATKKCGIIMPIADHPDYDPDHWKRVLYTLTAIISETGFTPRLVSEDAAVGLIHDRIVTNIYHDEIVVCDVSSKNPNVMFELGMRLAFDKPTIIIKDEKTGYSFDTGVIEHVQYPSSLRFDEVATFRKELVQRIAATYERSQQQPGFSPFLKSFGKTIVPASLDRTEITEGRYLHEQLQQMLYEIRLLRGNGFRDGKYKSGTLRISTRMKQQFLFAILARLKDDHPDYGEKELFEQLRTDAMSSGFELTQVELDAFLAEYRKKG